jgi:multidrug efflux pump subunit AcrA (membrane-fusion protein)
MAPGMTVRVLLAFAADEPEALALRIPAIGLGTDGEGTFALKVVGGDPLTVARAPVTVGAALGNEVEIISGLTAGDRIVLSAVRTLKPGALVRLMDQ